MPSKITRHWGAYKSVSGGKRRSITAISRLISLQLQPVLLLLVLVVITFLSDRATGFKFLLNNPAELKYNQRTSMILEAHEGGQEDLPSSHVNQNNGKKPQISRKIQGIPRAEEWTQLRKELIESFKEQDCSAALRIFAVVKLNGFHLVRSFMNRNMYDGILHLCASCNEMAEGMEVLRVMQAVGYEPLENTYYFIIRECLARDAVQEAQLVIESMARQNLKLKLRTYEPLFRQLLDKSNVPLLNQVWDHMRQHSILPPSEFFIAILMIWRETGEFDTKTANQALSDMADHAMFIPMESANELDSRCSGMTRVRVGEDGTCPCCGTRLRAVGLSAAERIELRENLRLLAGMEIDNFKQWLNNQRLEKGIVYTCVVDVPNVAYAEQNYPGGSFKVDHIKATVDLLEKRGETVLLVWPHRYMKPSVPNSTRYGYLTHYKTMLSEDSLFWIASLHSRGMLYSCPDTINDDLLWMFSTVALDDIPMKVITNDLMRDHRLALLASVPFHRWQRTQVLHYKVQLLATVATDEESGVRDAALPSPMQLLGMDIQQTPSFTCDMQNADLDPNRWHIPIRFEEAAAEQIRATTATNERKGEEVGRTEKEEVESSELVVGVQDALHRKNDGVMNTLCDDRGNIEAALVTEQYEEEEFGEIEGKFNLTSFLCLYVPDFLRQ